MYRPLFRALIAAVLLAVLLAAGAARADLLVNGNFEDGPNIPSLNPIFSVAPGGTALSGWTVVDGTINIISDNYWVPLSGHRSVVLSSTGPGAIQQAISTSSGAVYRLTYWVSGEPFSTPTIKHMRITAGATVSDQTFDVTPAWHWDMAWNQRTLDFNATGGTTTLKFASLDATQWGPALDSMKVELVSAGVPQGAPALAFAPVTPDPVHGAGRMDFSLPVAGHVKIAIHDVQGRQVAVLADADMLAGPHGVDFSPRTWSGSPGIYLATLQAGGRTIVRRFTVLY